jgi:hypothetical protein
MREPKTSIFAKSDDDFYNTNFYNTHMILRVWFWSADNHEFHPLLWTGFYKPTSDEFHNPINQANFPHIFFASILLIQMNGAWKIVSTVKLLAKNLSAISLIMRYH